MADILAPFAAALLLAYLLEPLCSLLERIGLPRALASLVAIVVGTVSVKIVAVVVVSIGCPNFTHNMTAPINGTFICLSIFESLNKFANFLALFSTINSLFVFCGKYLFL